MGGPLVARAPARKTPDARRCGRVLKLGERRKEMAAAMREVRTWQGKIWQDKIETEVEISGNGPPLIFLHGPWGLRSDREFLDLISGRHTVYAPKHPGTSAQDPEAIHQLDDWWDLILYYGELFDRLGLGNIALIGHSFGGMVACELAAAMPERVSRLVLIDPVGLWRDDLPVKNWMLLSQAELRGALFADPKGEAAQKFFSLPEEEAARIEAQVGLIWSQACTGKFVWPIPDRGLKKHIHRVATLALIVWGKADGVIAPAYAEEFARGIAKSRVALIDDAGHLPHLEQAQKVTRLVDEFLI
jgi:pimeloyl-ACP methyl ester carboxylesterase